MTDPMTPTISRERIAIEALSDAVDALIGIVSEIAPGHPVSLTKACNALVRVTIALRDTTPAGGAQMGHDALDGVAGCGRRLIDGRQRGKEKGS